MASIVELREKSDDALEEMLENAREEIFNLRFQHAFARLDDLSRLRHVRREIAQLETVINNRRLAVGIAAQQPEVVAALAGREWTAQARFSYEDSAWQVDFYDAKEKELTSTFVDLNKKKAKGRRARQKAK